MKKCVWILSFLVLCMTDMKAQKSNAKTYITIVGNHKGVVHAVGKIAQVNIDANNTSFKFKKENAKNNLTQFYNKLTQSGIKYTIFKPNAIESMNLLGGRTVNLILDSEAEYNKLFILCERMDLVEPQILYRFAPYNFEDEDERALGALTDATRRAKKLAQTMGKKTIKVVSIDDDTNNLLEDGFYKRPTAALDELPDFDGYPLVPYFDLSSNFEQTLSNLFRDLNVLHPSEGFEESKILSYNLQVTFEVE